MPAPALIRHVMEDVLKKHQAKPEGGSASSSTPGSKSLARMPGDEAAAGAGAGADHLETQRETAAQLPAKKKKKKEHLVVDESSVLGFVRMIDGLDNGEIAALERS